MKIERRSAGARILRAFVSLAAATVLTGKVLAGFPINISITPSVTAGPVNRNLTGSNVPWTDYAHSVYADGSLYGGVNKRALELAQGIAPAPMRYPGGEWADSYQWEMAANTAQAAWQKMPYVSSANSNELNYETVRFGTDEFLDYCAQLGCTPILQLNMHEADDAKFLTRAVEWLKYVKRKAGTLGPSGKVLPQVQYWELGNEPYLKAPTFGDKANVQYLSNESFANRVRLVIHAMRAVDPNLRFLLPFALDTWPGKRWCEAAEEETNPNCSSAGSLEGHHLGYGETLLKVLKGDDKANDLLPYVYALAVHYYMPLIDGVEDSSKIPSDIALYWATMAGTETVKSNLEAAALLWGRFAETEAKFAVTEYNAFYTKPPVNRQFPQDRYIASQAGAMYVMDMIRMLAYDPHVVLATSWNMACDWHFGAIGMEQCAWGENSATGPAFARPHYTALMLGNHLLQAGGVMTPVNVTVQSVDAHAQRVGVSLPHLKLPLATAAATRLGKTVKVLVLNKDVGTEGSVALTVEGDLVVEGSTTIDQFSASPGRPFATDETALVSLRLQGPAPTVRKKDGKSVVEWNMPPTSFALVTFRLR